MQSPNIRSSALRTKSYDVLIVDQDGGTSGTLQCVLEQHGCMARIAEGRDHALAEIRRRRPEVVVMDLTLVGGTAGVVLAEAVRAETPDEAPIAIVAITTGPDRALARCFDACLAEPVEMDEITDIVRRLAAEMRAARVAAREAAG